MSTEKNKIQKVAEIQIAYDVKVLGTTIKAKPFLKWAGGKQQLLEQYNQYFPPKIERYFEPFLGGGAVYFYLWNKKAITGEAFLFDNNKELVNVYQVVKRNVDELIELLAIHQAKHNKDYYYKIRDLDRKQKNLSNIEIAARTIYLNKTCFNGLYRVNSKGQFNVPMGSYKNPTILNPDVLRAASEALSDAVIVHRDFQSIIEIAGPKDFVYFDPPYDPVSKTSNFTSYTAGNFGDEDQRNLASIYKELSKKKCLCMLSNSYTPFIVELYKNPNFRIEPVLANRAINSKADGRGPIKEVLILNY
jgi:DNA adenine methylase